MQTPKHQLGLTLVELMLSLLLGAALTLVIVNVYLSVQKNNRTVSAMAEVQENSRYATAKIISAFRQGGGFGLCQEFNVVDEFDLIRTEYSQTKEGGWETKPTLEKSKRGLVAEALLKMPVLYYAASNTVASQNLGIKDYAQLMKNTKIRRGTKQTTEDYVVMPLAVEQLRFIGDSDNKKEYPYIKGDGFDTVAPLKINRLANQLVAGNQVRYQTDLSKLKSGALYIISASDKCDVFNNNLMYNSVPEFYAALEQSNDYLAGLSDQLDGHAIKDRFGPNKAIRTGQTIEAVETPVQWQQAYTSEFELYEVGFYGLGIELQQDNSPALVLGRLELGGNSLGEAISGSGSADGAIQSVVDQQLYSAAILARNVPYLSVEYGLDTDSNQRVTEYKLLNDMQFDDWAKVQALKINLIFVSSEKNVVDRTDQQAGIMFASNASFSQANNMFKNASQYLEYSAAGILVKDGRYAEKISTVVAMRSRNL